LIPFSSARSSSSQSDEKSFVDLFSSEALPMTKIFLLLIWRPTLLSASAEPDAFPASFVLLIFGHVAAFGT